MYLLLKAIIGNNLADTLAKESIRKPQMHHFLRYHGSIMVPFTSPLQIESCLFILMQMHYKSYKITSVFSLLTNKSVTSQKILKSFLEIGLLIFPPAHFLRGNSKI